ncbi:RagB/SusD family nutrient uptake outer membrane protein [Pedobacter yulinensis]|uniref:RagB/SusD family nutrient uptake outer membrane protein n=1 Tax=Pedobacter yulinensis TaxID=2126353 RepID=A0A2T3HRF3_9SPHI|nr:RagB/SusD family nutrient uptake outer membrane protein [Pedobacter yulinensis]PST84996.1 RagB/SusD family nutrient uptake outer membrane protein [Pedobacter yulinensis]
MRKTFNKYIAALLLGTLLVSCEKNIELTPTDTISNETAIKTYDDLDRAVIGVYSSLNYQQAFYTSTIMADENRWGLDNSTRNYGLGHRWVFDSSNGDVTAAWASLYTTIDRINRALESADAVTTANATQEAGKGRLKGELLAVRGFALAELLRWFAPTYESTALGVVVITKSEILGKPQRNTFAETMTQINADLSQADALIPASFTDLFRITKPAVAAIRARAALYAKDWAGARTYAAQAIAAKGTLATGTNYANIWKDSNTSENYFQLRRNSNAGSVRTYWTDDNTDVFFSPSYKLMDTYDKTNDVRYNAFILNDTSVPSTRENWKVNKYSGQDATNRFNNIKVFRVSEMYLILAEANAELNDLSAGATALNAVRSARIAGYTPQAFASKEALIDGIMLERFKELAFEGHRFFDLRRRQLPVVRDDRDIAVGTSVPKTLPTTGRNYILPIPAAEVFANPGIQQNPGY